MHVIDLRTVLVPSDLSDRSLDALPYARELARLRGATIVLAHAGSSQAELARAEPRLEEIARGLAPVPCAVALGVGPVVDFLVQLPDRYPRPLLLMATHGRRGAAREVLGTTAGHVVSKAPCPVLTVKRSDRRLLVLPEPEEALTASPRYPVHRILLPTDLSPESMKAVDYAYEFSQAFGAELLLIHVIEHGTPDSWNMVRRRSAQRFLEQIGRRALVPPAHVFLETGHPARTIVKVAMQYRVDLVVMATRGERRLAGLRLPSVTRAVVRRAPCPVLAVKSPEYELVAVEPLPPEVPERVPMASEAPAPVLRP